MNSRPQPGWWNIAACVFLAAIVWAVFGQTRHYEFVNYDDPDYVFKNPAITQGLSWSGIVGTLTHVNIGTWFPLTDISHQLAWQLYGLNAGGHHLTNVLLHAATAIVLFLALRKLTGMFWRAVFVAAVFAIHPLRVESVAWVVERKDVLSGLFFMLTLWAWAGHVQQRRTLATPEAEAPSLGSALNPRRWTPGYFLALVFFALGLMSKSMLVTLPCVLLLLDYWPLNRLPAGGPGAPRRWLLAWRGLILEKIPFLLLSAAICAVTLLTQNNAVVLAQNSTFLWRAGNALTAYTDYLGHMICPVGLTVIYPASETNPSIWSVSLAALLLLAISAGALAGRRKHPYLLVGWLWYLGMLLPVIDIMQAGQNARADRYTYLPQIGLYILMAWGAVALCAAGRPGRVVLGFVGVGILAGLLVAARLQTTYWRDSVSLWTRSLACNSWNYYAENYLGSALANQGKPDAAIPHFERALKIKPDYVEAHVNLGITFANQARRAEAVQHFERALELNPDSADAHYNLGYELAAQGKRAEGVQHLERTLQLKPNHANARYELGLTLASQGKWPEAIRQLDQTLQLKLDETDARYVLAVALANRKKWGEAGDLYQQVLHAKPDFAEAHNNLAIALASEGKSPEAVKHFEQALALATAQGNTALAESIRARLKSYPPALPPPQATGRQ